MTRQKYEHPYRPANWATEIYAMPAFPTLTVSDSERSYRWYQEALGFVDVFTARGADGAPVIAHLRWCRFGDLLLTPAREALDESPGRGMMLNFSAEEVDELAERIRAAGGTIDQGPVDRPWNTRDLTVLDPDGYRLNFTAPQAALLDRLAVGEMPSMEEITERLRGGGPKG